MKADTIAILPFSEQHTQGVVDVILAIQRAEFGVPVTLADQPDLLDIQNYYQTGRGNFWLALHAGDVVGTLCLLDIGNRQAALRKLFVKAPFRGPKLGVAHRLMDALLEWGALRGVGEIYLGTTAQYRAAHRFYEKRGFLEIPKADLPEAFPVMSVDSKFYTYVISALTIQDGDLP